MTVQELSQSLKNKYPEYEGYDDQVLVDALVKKYPEYKGWLTVAPLKDQKTLKLEQTIQNHQRELGQQQDFTVDNYINKEVLGIPYDHSLGGDITESSNVSKALAENPKEEVEDVPVEAVKGLHVGDFSYMDRITEPTNINRPLHEIEAEENRRKTEQVLKESENYDLMDSMQDLANNPKQLVPFLGSATELKHLGAVVIIASKLDKGEELSLDEYKALNQFITESERRPSFLAGTFEIIKALPSFFGEMGAGKLIFTGAKKGGTALLSKMLSKNFKAKVKAGIAKKPLVGKIAEKTAETAVKTGVVSEGGAIAGGSRVDVGEVERNLQEWAQGDQDYKDIESIHGDDHRSQSRLDMAIEVLSEQSGGLFRKAFKGIRKGAKDLMVKRGLYSTLVNKNPGKEKIIKQAFESMGYHGVLEEMMEERLGEALRGIAYEMGVDDEGFKYELPTLKQLAQEFVAFSVPGGAQKLATKISEVDIKQKRDKLNNKFKDNKAWQEVQKYRTTKDHDPEVAEMAEHFIQQNPDLGETSVLQITNQAKKITREELEKRGETFEQFGLDSETEVADIAGSTEYKMFDGIRKVLIKLNKRADHTTVVEEFYGYFYKSLSPQDQAVWDEYYKSQETKLSSQELFEKEGVNYFYATQKAKNLPEKIFKKLKELFTRILGTQPKEIQDLYKRAGKADVRAEGKVSGESYQLKKELDITREERKAIKTVKLTGQEKNLAQKSEYPTRDVEAVIKRTKSQYPKSAGWAGIEANKVKTNKQGELEVEFKQVPYTFHLKDGKRPTGKDKSKYERVLGNRIVKEVLKVVDRAKKGDKNAKTILSHKTWYSELKTGIREQYGGFLDLFAEALGSLSPKTPVNENYKSAEILLEEFSKGSYDSYIEPYVEYINEGGKPGKYEGGVPTKPNGKKFGTNSKSAMAVIASLWIDMRPGMAPKARNFAKNILGESKKATIDVWAGRFLQRLSGGKRIPVPAEGAVTGKVLSDGVNYGGQFGIGGNAFDHAVEKLEKLNIQELEGLDSPSLQAVVWFLEKEHWAKNNWTNLAGEGGSFETNLVQEQFPKSEGGGVRPRGYSRTQVGHSRQKGDTAPKERDVEKFRDEIIKLSRSDKNIKAIRAEGTIGLYTYANQRVREQSFDTELVTVSDHIPVKIIKKIIRTAKKDGQLDVFFSKVAKDDHPNARPGLEVYFNKNLSVDEVTPIMDLIESHGFDGFTMIREKRTPKDMFTGVRVQVIPELTARYDKEFREQVKDEKSYESWVEQKKDGVAELQLILKDKFNSYDIHKYDYITEVIGYEKYDKVAKRSSSTLRKTWWSGSSGHERVQEAVAEYEKSEGKTGPDSDGDSGPEKSYQLKPFYSKAIRAVEKPKFGKSKKIQGIIPYLKNQGVSDEEIKWMGVDQFVGSMPQKHKSVTQKDLLDLLSAMEISIEEVELGKKVQRSSKAINPFVQSLARTIYHDYTLPGGHDYRELLLRPTRGIPVLNRYRGRHFKDFSNIIAHVRFNTRFDEDGNKVLFIEEVQSDWHQEGKKKGIYLLRHQGLYKTGIRL